MSGATVVTGLTEGTPKDGDRPDISVLSRNDGANVIRLSFRAGQAMPCLLYTSPSPRDRG